MKPFQAQRTLAGGVALVFLATNALFAYTPETNLWAERRKTARRQTPTLLASLPLGPQSGSSLAAPLPAPQNLSPALSQNVARSVPKRFLKENATLLSALSPAHGTIRKVAFSHRQASRRPVIVHIQDVHMNPEAQWNIREAVSSLMQTGRVNLLALEGAAEEIKLQTFVDFPNRQAVKLTADYLLKENKISGPIHAALTAHGHLPRVLGIEDPARYRANVQAYRDSAPKLKETRQRVKERKLVIKAEKKQVFSAALRAFDEKVESYRVGKTSLGDYVLLFSSLPRRTTPPQISLFQKALMLERTLNFRQVEAERARLIEALTATLTKQETDALLAESLAYRSGQLRYADFYAGLSALCRRKGIDLMAFPAMDEYVKYVLLADGIDAEALMEELAEREKAAYGALAQNAAERNLIATSRRAWLTGKLVDFALTPGEWREYKSVEGDPYGEPGDSSPALVSFESFYREADARDEAMAKNVAAAVPQDPGSSALATVLVTGGYHAEGMAKALTAQGFTVLSFVPKIEKVDTAQGSSYLSVFTQEKTPLDKLFEGQKLFLAHEPAKLADIQLTVPGLIAAADSGKTFGSVQEAFRRMIPPALASRIQEVVEKTTTAVTRLKVVLKEGWVFTVEATPGVSQDERRFMMEIKKQSLNPLRLLTEQLFVLPAALATALLAFLATATQTPALVPVAAVVGLAVLVYFRNPFIAFHPEKNADLLKVPLAKYQGTVGFGFLFFGGLTIVGLIAALTGQPSTDLSVVAGFVFQHVFGYGAAYHTLFNLLSPVPATADLSPPPALDSAAQRHWARFNELIRKSWRAVLLDIDGTITGPDGRAASLWMTRLFEWVGALWGGEESAHRWGAHYKAHAPIYEWSLALMTAAANLGAVLFLIGTAWAMIPLLLTVLFLPSHVFPARWLKTGVKVGWGKAGVMALVYFILVATAPLLVLDFSWGQAVLQATGWKLTYTLHRRFDPLVDETHRREISVPRVKTHGEGIGFPSFKRLRMFWVNEGIGPEAKPISPDLRTGPTRTARGPPLENQIPGAEMGLGSDETGPGVIPEISPLVSNDYVPGIYREKDLAENFADERLKNQRWSREAVIDRQLALLVLNGELEKRREEELKKRARDLLAEAEAAEGFNPTTMERTLIACNIVKKVAKGKGGFNPFSIRNNNINNVAAALQENGLTLRQRFMRLLHSFEALKQIPNVVLYDIEDHMIADTLQETVRSFDNRDLAVDAFESYIQRVVHSQKPITVPVFFDDNGEAVFALRFILDQMLENKNLRFILVGRNGQFREDASVDDIQRILKLPVFRKDVQSVGGRLRVMAGCAGDGINVRQFTPALTEALLSAEVVLSIGQMNFEGLNTFKKDVYFLYVPNALGNTVVTGVPAGKGIFAFLPAGTRAFSNYTDSSFRRFRYGAGVTIPVAGRTLIEAARVFPGNRINEHFEILENPDGRNRNGNSPTLSNPVGLATSRWMTRLFEWFGTLWGGEDAARRWGAHYKAHAPAYEWLLGLAVATANIGTALFLAGTAWALVPLLLTALFLPSHVFPARWIKTDVKVDWFKAGLMAVFYFALVAAAPLLLTDVNGSQLLLQAAGWGLTLVLHRRFDSADMKPQSPNRAMANPSPALVNGLTMDQQRLAAQVTGIVGGKPTLLGLEDYMYGAAQAAVQTAAVGSEVAGTLAPSIKGAPVLFVDARSVATKKQRTALASFLKGKPDAVVFTNADDLNIAGVDVRIRPKVFSPLSTIEEHLPSGVVEVALAPLGPELRGLSQGRGIQMFQTTALKLNSLGADETVTEAARQSWLLSDLFTLMAPALVPEKWDEVLKVLTAIARSA